MLETTNTVLKWDCHFSDGDDDDDNDDDYRYIDFNDGVKNDDDDDDDDYMQYILISMIVSKMVTVMMTFI